MLKSNAGQRKKKCNKSYSITGYLGNDEPTTTKHRKRGKRDHPSSDRKKKKRVFLSFLFNKKKKKWKQIVMMTCWRIPTSGPDFITTKGKKREKKKTDWHSTAPGVIQEEENRKAGGRSFLLFVPKSYYSNVMQSLPFARRCIDPNPAPLNYYFLQEETIPPTYNRKKLHIHSSRYCNDMSSSNEKNTTATVFFHIGS